MARELAIFFSSSVSAALGQWIDDVVKGIQGGHHILRLSSLSGLLLGILDLEAKSKENQFDGTYTSSLYLGNAKNGVEEELVIAVAEIMDMYSHALIYGPVSDWEKEFQPASRGMSFHLILDLCHRKMVFFKMCSPWL